jgi:hypothetical protein
MSVIKAYNTLEQVLVTLHRKTQRCWVQLSRLIITMHQAVQCVHIFLYPFINYIIFFLQLCLLFQSSSTNPFLPISLLIPSAQVGLGFLIFFFLVDAIP